ncbi:argonaute-like protein [Collybia nuda]|uniref:Argonaute-like protein n=1 Tax=Collybia nuda TaxID=64659 RepID=A0A9P5Y280_9AGAR|nr:argonaute-like protein [Collybia nuda]
MPPRAAPNPSAPRGRGGGGPPRGGRGGAARGGTPSGQVNIPAHVTTVGVKRPDFGTAGRPIAVHVNAFVTSIPDKVIYHYDAVISTSNSSSTTLPARFNGELIKKLQTEVAPSVFTPKVVYDGRKNIFSTRLLPFGPSNAAEFDVTLSAAGAGAAAAGARPPKIYKIKLVKVAEINPEVLQRFIEGEQSQDNQVLTAIMALNVVIRMEPNQKYPFNVRSFFTNQEVRPIGGGIELWRGYFQSVRPAMGKMLINVDISTGMMYKAGPLINLCLDYLNKPPNNPRILAPASGFPDRERLRLQRFLAGVRIVTPHTATGGVNRAPRVVKKLSTAGANAITFTMHGGGGTMTVAQYFQKQLNKPLQFPNLICVEVGTGALIPIELCQVPPGQIMRKQVPPEKTKSVVEFSTKKPAERFASIRAGLDVLAYGQSEYVRQFGMNVETTVGPLPVQARILQPPTLKYGPGSKQPTITPRDGAWNMIDKRLWKPQIIGRWAVVVYDQRRFPESRAREMVDGFVGGCRSVGMKCDDVNPIIRYENGQGRIGDQLKAVGAECVRQKGGPPNLIVVVLPDGGDDIYTAVKHFGDVTMGVATQCLKSVKCSGARLQYWANVCLKVNVKLGGINLIPEPSSVSVLTDPRNPTIVMGADVIHPAPGSQDRPSFTAVVANVDSDTAKYIATTRVQTSRQEMIDDLQEMCKHLLSEYMGYRRAMEKKSPTEAAPKRIIFYRDGVSEGQFEQVLRLELPLLRAACDELKIRPKITMIVVGKRHHIRMAPQNPAHADRSGNCPAGTILDRDIAHPVEFDWYLQSHGGLLGTSRSAHYSVLHDDNGFNADSLQALTFALCHVYARATRSVSIPAPVYYADIVCSRAKNHYDPQGTVNFSDTQTESSSAAAVALEGFRRAYKALHPTQAKLMYFS